MILGGSLPFEGFLMRRLLLFLIRHRALPRHRRVYWEVREHLWHPAHFRDPELTGWIDLGDRATPESVDYFRHWWKQMNG